MNIYVGNLSYAATEDDLEKLFSKYGPVAAVKIIRDRPSGYSKGFGFVKMEKQEDGKDAIKELDNFKLMERPLKVQRVDPRRQGGRSQQPRRSSSSSAKKSGTSLPNLERALEQIEDKALRIRINKSFQEMTEEMEHLRHEYASSQTVIQIEEHRVRHLQEQLEQTRNKAKQNAIISFFQEMNSVKHSSLLDQLLKVEKLLERLHQQETEIPEELELLPAIVDMFSQFLEMQGIEPKYDLGSKREITLSESEQYEYFGSQFENKDERKTIEVISSGWTYNGELIIKPRVKEVM